MEHVRDSASPPGVVTQGSATLLRDALAWSDRHREKVVSLLQASIKEFKNPIGRPEVGMVLCNIWMHEKWEPMEISEAEAIDDINEMGRSLKAYRKWPPLDKPECTLALLQDYLLHMFWERNPGPYSHLTLEKPMRKLLYRFAAREVTKADLAEYVLEGGVLDGDSETVTKLELSDDLYHFQDE